MDEQRMGRHREARDDDGLGAPAEAPGQGTTGGSRRRVYLHTDVLDWMRDPSSPRQLTQRARLVLWQLFAQGTPTQVKSVKGAGRGWLRSDLGGNHGHQFYLWWTRGGALPLKGRGISHDAVLVRAPRHHDETDRALDPGELSDWLPLEAKDLEGCELAPALLPTQREVLEATGRARIVRGYPGTGKTTLLGLAALATPGARVLYLTYSDRLAARAKAYFNEFARAPGGVRVMTFRALFGELWEARGMPPRGEADEAALARAIEGYQGSLSPWTKHLECLRAELHASFAGAALPEAFRDAPACAWPGFEVDAYVTLRGAALGEGAAEVAARLGAHLHARDALPHLAPGPTQAFALLGALRAKPSLPAWCADFDAVVVDEVQDLTRVESALLVEVAHAMRGPSGRAVELIAAGDEGQTVRPTDFDWGVFSELVSRRFPDPVSFDLDVSVRSPRLLTAVLHRTSELYRELAKCQRPRGRAADEPEETVPGRVLRCVVRDDDELARLAEAVDALPGAALVFPGASAVSGLSTPDALSSDAAKGLDFSVVAVLGAARHLAELRALAQGARADALRGVLARTRIDQLRVAVSRASDTLIFVDRANDPGVDEVEKLLCEESGERLEGSLGAMDLADVITLLERRDETAEELVRGFIADARAALPERPGYALDRARRARGLLGRSDSKVGVTDLGLREEAMRVQGLCAVLVAVSDDTRDVDRRDLFSEANKSLHAGRESELAKAALGLRDLRLHTDAAAGSARALVETLSRLDAREPLWEPVLRAELRRWCARCASAAMPAGTRGVVELVEAVERVAEALRGEGAPALPSLDLVRRAAVDRLLEVERFADARAIARRLEPPSPRDEARCCEALGNHREAAELYELAGSLVDALRCARAGGEIDRACELAARCDAPDRGTLSRLQALRTLLAECEAAGDTLRQAETDALRVAFDRLHPPRRARR
ncbi:MAG: hypothetical protein R3A48_13705 [Polyangiales bacterium]